VLRYRLDGVEFPPLVTSLLLPRSAYPAGPPNVALPSTGLHPFKTRDLAHIYMFMSIVPTRLPPFPISSLGLIVFSPRSRGALADCHCLKHEPKGPHSR
jgi:hypothetical protein